MEVNTLYCIELIQRVKAKDTCLTKTFDKNLTKKADGQKDDIVP